ncbi:hypothetical protein KAR91_78940 [Candidatus Pacearchaeota archaeon]|nr:hypothetical protein [Candidatus Pacearchaeota archaeon]
MIKAKTITVSLYLYSFCLPPYIGYTTPDDSKTIHLMAFIKQNAVNKMLQNSTCFVKAVEAIWARRKEIHNDQS